MKKLIFFTGSLFLILIVTFVLYDTILAHCDTLDGPVVAAARNSLETGNVNYVFAWVQKENEAEIREAFEKTSHQIKEHPDSKEFAEKYFFETVVRVHRQGEGETYTGLKPAGGELGPVIELGDKAITDGNAKELKKLILDAVERGIDERFKEVMEKKNYELNNVEAGREYVNAYVQFLHFSERIYDTADKHSINKEHESPEKDPHKKTEEHLH